MNRKLIFQGSAGEALGEEWSVNAPTIADAFRIVHANKPNEYLDYFSQDNAQGEFSVKLAGEALEASELLLYNLKGEDIVVTPIPKGSRGPVEKILIAVVLLVIAYYMPQMFPEAATAATAATAGTGEATIATFFYTQATNMLYMVGINMAMMGITQLLTKEPSTDKEEEGAMFGGPAATLKHGQPVPICYGKLMVSGTPITFGFGAYKLEPTNNMVFGSDNPNAWDGEVYLAADTGSDSGDDDSGGGDSNNNNENEDGDVGTIIDDYER
jgi:predicted phage tail protein